MKAIKRILFVCSDIHLLNPLFQVILNQAVEADPILSVAEISVESAVISWPGAESVANYLPAPEMESALGEMGFSCKTNRSREIKLHPEILLWADSILVPGLMEEDMLCAFSHDAWSKIVQIESFCGKHEAGKQLLSYDSLPKTKDYYSSMAAKFKELIPYLIGRIKDSLTNALIVKGIGMNKKTAWGSAIVIGRASVVRRGYDLENFVKENILVVDRLGAVLKGDIDTDLAVSVIKKFVETPDFYEDKVLEIKDKLQHFEAMMKGGTVAPKRPRFFPDGENAIEIIVRNAKGIICSRGYHVNEVMNSPYHIPYISSCVGATQQIKDNQLIVMDTSRGEVYDASLLRQL